MTNDELWQQRERDEARNETRAEADRWAKRIRTLERRLAAIGRLAAGRSITDPPAVLSAQEECVVPGVESCHLVDRFAGGESIVSIAGDYGAPPADVERALQRCMAEYAQVEYEP